MAKNIKFQHSSAGYVEFMKSSGVSAEIKARAERVASSANAMVGQKAGMHNENFIVHANGSGDRIGAVVVAANPHSIAHTHKHNTLLKALDAGRG